MEKKTLGAFLAALRKASGMTQKQLADKLNVSDKAVSRWERDESAPDLTLIPVIAEVFGVTSDELLRGQRASPEDIPERISGKAEKQIRHILRKTLTKFKIQSAISITVALAGLIGAMILNLGFLRAYVGFFVGCLFYVVASVCQVIFLILLRSAVDPEEMEPEMTAPVLKTAVLGSELVFGIIWFLFSACIPLVMWTHDTYLGLSAGSWLEYGLFFGMLSTLPAFGVCAIINLKRGYWSTRVLKTPLGKLRVRSFCLALASVTVLGVLHIGLAIYLSESGVMMEPTRSFSSWEDFKEYMETPMDYDGQPMTYQDGYSRDGVLYMNYVTEDGGIYTFRFDELLTDIYAHLNDEEDGVPPVVQYRKLNMSVASMTFGSGSDLLLPVQVFSYTALQEGNQKAENILLIFAVLYPPALAAVYIRYQKKKAQL